MAEGTKPPEVDPITLAAAAQSTAELGDERAKLEAQFFRDDPISAKDIASSYRLRNQKLEEELADLRSDRDFRKEYAPKIYELIWIWLLSVVALVILDGVTVSGGINTLGKSIGFELSDSVVLALIGGTTASVIGLLVIVITYIFPRRNKG